MPLIDLIGDVLPRENCLPLAAQRGTARRRLHLSSLSAASVQQQQQRHASRRRIHVFIAAFTDRSTHTYDDIVSGSGSDNFLCCFRFRQAPPYRRLLLVYNRFLALPEDRNGPKGVGSPVSVPFRYVRFHYAMIVVPAGS